MIQLSICAKPLSVNKAWQGKRFKTQDYKDFEEEVLWKLPRGIQPIDGMLMVHYKFFMKNHKMADNDNPVKTIQDVLVKSGIIKDDRQIYRTISDKIPSDVEKIEVEISPFVIE